tara:strand:- start:1026 stop:1895 length:870 start_codon:yes stop_codon:yes gene_type:complete
MKKILILILTLFISNAVHAEQLPNVLGKTAEIVSNLIPGEGVTEVSLDYTNSDEDRLNFSILGVRDILGGESSNLFTQFSLMNQEINSSGRIIGNLGFGYRILSPGDNFMFGVNTFYDSDLTENQDRFGLGLEAKGSVLDLTANAYQKLNNSLVVDGDREQVLSGWDYNLTSQLPTAPWARINFNGYKWEAERAALDTKGNIYSLELDVTNSLEVVSSMDRSSLDGVADEYSISLNYVYPPEEKTAVMSDGRSDEFFEKADMKQKLREKVKRRNKLVMEIQGAVVLTKK